MIKNIENIHPTVLDFSIKRLECIASVHLYVNKDKYFDDISTADILFLIKEKEVTYELMIRFVNVEAFHFETGGGLTYISGFNVRDLTQNSYHPMKYQIEDYENGVLHFYCADIEFVSMRESEQFVIE